MRLLPILLLTGCASFPQLDTSKAEIAWQTIHVVDAMQTVSIATRQCYHEADPITRRIIGKHPNQLNVALWWAGTAFGHAFVSKKLKDDHPKLYKFWQILTIGRSAYVVTQNHKIGLGPFAREDC